MKQMFNLLNLLHLRFYMNLCKVQVIILYSYGHIKAIQGLILFKEYLFNKGNVICQYKIEFNLKKVKQEYNFNIHHKYL